MLRIGFGCLLIYASIDKIRHPHHFAQMVENYRVVGSDLSNWTAVFLPYLEVFAGFMLITGFWQNTAAVINLCLMTVFFILVTQAYIRDLDISCGCYSVEEGDVIGPWKIVINLIYMMLSAALVMLCFHLSVEARNAHHESLDQKNA